MPTHPAYLRQQALAAYLRQARGRPVPFEELRRHLEAQPFSADFDRTFSRRTCQRDVQQLAEKYGVEVRHRRGQGYYLAAENTWADAGRQRLDEALHLHELLQLPSALAAFVQPETRRAQGLEHLRPLLRAAQASCLVEFQYQKFWEDAAVARTAGPLLLKEFRGRWYVLASMAGSGWLACFGLDRISELRVTAQPFAPPTGFDATTYYENAFGIIRPDAEEKAPPEIILRFTPTQGRYALGYPLHASQRVLRHDETEIRLALTVFDTHDLRMELLSYGPEVEVLAPANLRAWVQARHHEATGRHQDAVMSAAAPVAT